MNIPKPDSDRVGGAKPELEGYELVEEPAAPPPAGAAPTCMGCGALMRAGAVLCSRCGFDTRTGVRAVTASDGTRSVKKCASCGYELTGLKRPICPECGASISGKDPRRLDREHSVGVARAEWIKPLVMLGAGWGIVVTHALLTGGAAAAGTYLAHYAITLPVGIVAYLICCICGVGFGTPFPLTAWRLVGAFALVDAAVVGASYLPSVYIEWGVPALVAVGIFEHLFDLDLPEAFAAGFFTYAARTVAVLWITGQLAALF